MRVENHPILSFSKGKPVKFTFDGALYEGFENEPIIAALHASGVRALSHSHKHGRPRGLYCAIGNCSSCIVVVDGEPNVRACVTELKEGMVVETQKGKGDIK